MTRLWLGASVALLTVLPPALAAQDRDTEPSRERSRIEIRPRGVAFMSRPRIGVSLATEANSETDRLGARVVEVVPDGPADDAGIRAGDIITRFDGTRLGGDNPSRKLMELAQKLEAGDTVKIEYQRDGDKRTATVVAENLGPMEGMTLPRMRIEQMMPALEGMRDNLVMFGGGWPGLELVDLNAGLGEYFGTSEGVLVVDAPADSTLPLRAGDVITRIDGRTPRSAGHALRILGSYTTGETVKFDVMRKQQRQTLTWKVSERRGVFEWKGPHREPLERPNVRLRETTPGA